MLGRLRSWSLVPVIVISARAEEREKVQVLDLGADDYMTKRFGMDELLARTRANLWRVKVVPDNPAAAVELHVGSLCIDLLEQTVTLRGREVHLTPIEWGLLAELASNADRVVSHRQLLERVWGSAYSFGTDGLRTYIKQLRKKLESDPAHPVYIQNKAGVGYILRTRQEA